MIKEIGLFFSRSTLDVIAVSQNITLQAGVETILNASQRQLLFYDEMARIFIILKSQNEDLDEQHIEWTSYLSCTIDGWMDDIQRHSLYGVHEEINKERIEGLNFFFQMVSNKKMIFELVEGKLVMIWEVEMLIPFPRVRASTPKIQLIASITVKPEILIMSQYNHPEIDDDIFTNVLESLSKETMIYGITPFLSLSRISSASIVSNVESLSLIETLRKVVKKVFTCGSVISLRTRSSMVTVPNFQRILLCVDIESCSANQLPTLIEDIEIKIKGRVAQRIENEIGFPITLAFQEKFLILYYIPFDSSIDQGIMDLLALPVAIFVKMKPQLLEGEYSFSLMSQWHTTIHVSKDQTRVSRYHSVVHTEARVPDSNLFLQKQLVYTNNYNLLGSKNSQFSTEKSPFWKISLTLTAPKCVKIWKVFDVEIVLVNQSNISKDISLSVLSKIQDIDYKALSLVLNKETQLLLEEKAIYALHKEISVDPVHILPLTNDIRIAPLNSQGCYFCSISFIAIREGLFSLEGIRITDLHTGTYVDCRSLPRIFVYS